MNLIRSTWKALVGVANAFFFIIGMILMGIILVTGWTAILIAWLVNPKLRYQKKQEMYQRKAAVAKKLNLRLYA